MRLVGLLVLSLVACSGDDKNVDSAGTTGGGGTAIPGEFEATMAFDECSKAGLRVTWTSSQATRLALAGPIFPQSY